MEKLTFSGITRLDPGESLATDNYSFQSEDRRIIDRLLELGARTHRHNAAAPLADPTEVPGVSSGTVGGAIPAALPIYVGYTLVDARGGETALSPSEMVTTSDGILRPESAMVAEMDYAAGTLLTDTYYYALTWTDGVGGETGMGPTVSVDREPGFATAQVLLSGLSDGMAEAGAVGWRLYRATGGAEFGLIATGLAAADTFTDTGAIAADCTQLPPRDEDNTTGSTNTLAVTLPGATPAGAVGLRLYVSLDGSFTEGGLIGTYLVPDDLGDVKQFTVLEVVPARPPVVSTSIGGANKIDPDTELLDYTWKRPVEFVGDLPAAGNVAGDVRLVTTPVSGTLPVPYVWDGDSWEVLLAGSGAHLIEDESVAANQRGKLDFRGAGVAVTDDAANDRTVVTISGGGGGGPMPLGTALEWKDANDVTVLAIEGRERESPFVTTLFESNYSAQTYAETGWGNANFDVVPDYLVPTVANLGANNYNTDVVNGDFLLQAGYQILTPAAVERLGVVYGGGLGTDGMSAVLANFGTEWWFYIGIRAGNGRGDPGALDFVSIPFADIPANTLFDITLERKNAVLTATLVIDDPAFPDPIVLTADRSADAVYGTGNGLGYGMHADWTAADSWRSTLYNAYNYDWQNELVIESTPVGGTAHTWKLSEDGRFRDSGSRDFATVDGVDITAPDGLRFSYEGRRAYLDGLIVPVDNAEPLIATGLPLPDGPAGFTVLDAAGAPVALTVAYDPALGTTKLTRGGTGTDAFRLDGLNYFTA